MYKTFLSLGALIFLIGCTGELNNSCLITGMGKNLEGREIKLRIDWQDDTITFGPDGNFKKEVKINRPIDAFLISKGINYKLYLKPGKSLVINFDCNDFINTVIFDGELSVPNEFLKQMAIKDEAFWKESFKYYRPPFKALDYLKFIDSVKSVQLVHLKNFSETNKEFSKEFYNRIYNAIEYNYLTSRYSYPRRLNSKVVDQMEVTDDWFNFLHDIDFGDASNLDVYEVEFFHTYYTSLEAAKRNGINPNDISDNSDWVHEVFNYVKKEYNDKKFYDNILHFILWEYMENQKLGTAGIENLVDEYLTRSSDPKKVEHINRLVTKWKHLAKGQPAPDFTLTDEKGLTVSLKDFRGKFVFIDFWFNGCGSCLVNFPDLKEVISDFKDRNIVFISISIEKERSDWLKMLKEGSDDGFQFDKMSQWIQVHDPGPRVVARDYSVIGYPTYILIDPQGNYVNSRCEWPRRKKLEALLNKQPGL
jgi:peroxiredoxin